MVNMKVLLSMLAAAAISPVASQETPVQLDTFMQDVVDSDEVNPASCIFSLRVLDPVILVDE